MVSFDRTSGSGTEPTEVTTAGVTLASLAVLTSGAGTVPTEVTTVAVRAASAPATTVGASTP